MSCHELSHSCHTQKLPIRTACRAVLQASCHSCHELSHNRKVVTTQIISLELSQEIKVVTTGDNCDNS